MLKIETDFSGIEAVKQRLRDAVNDNAVKMAVNQKFVDMCDPYVPMDTGTLKYSVAITPDAIRYTAPYAHYMYIGQVYSPNYPIVDKSGQIIGWASPKDKVPTGRPIHYSTDKHPLATKEWDKAMMRDRGDVFTQEVAKILQRRMNGG